MTTFLTDLPIIQGLPHLTASRLIAIHDTLEHWGATIDPVYEDDGSISDCPIIDCGDDPDGTWDVLFSMTTRTLDSDDFPDGFDMDQARTQPISIMITGSYSRDQIGQVHVSFVDKEQRSRLTALDDDDYQKIKDLTTTVPISLKGDDWISTPYDVASDVMEAIADYIMGGSYDSDTHLVKDLGMKIVS